DQLVTVLDRAEALGLKVILDMHQDVFGEAFGSHGVPAWATRTDGHTFEPQESWLLEYLQPAVQAAFEHLYEDDDLRQAQIDAWLHVVDRVQDHPALLGYDLLNEPFGKIRDGEDLIGAAGRVEREQLTPMYQRLTDAIAAVDADHWVFIEPPNLASLGVATSLGAVTGPKVAIYPHMYDANIELATYGDDGNIVYDPAFFTQWADAIRGYAATHRVPMLVGEWGIAHPERPGMDAFVADTLATLDRETSGWSMFTMCQGEGYCPFDAAGAPRPAIDQILSPYARAIAGAPTSSTWDPEARTLRVRFAETEAGGPTEIWLGEDLTYPDGWVVETSDAEGTWTSSYDPDTGVLSVDLSATGEAHAICVSPDGVPGGCTATDPEPEPEPAAPESPPAAVPVAGRPGYTG
ncbi:MAG: cellulase family glycosylhydrolase, partial [Acidimicrobiales bacterium]|nr:cellulase family glycosylhydrolase [Acidimicrobiales bacterium]